MGALRILTNRAAMRDEVKSASEFWSGWQRLIEDDRFLMCLEPAGFEAAWRELTGTLSKGTAAETDAYLAAFALAGKHSLVSFDRGMNRFAKIELLIPS